MTPQRLAELHALLDDAATDDDLAHSRTGLALLEGLREVLERRSASAHPGLLRLLITTCSASDLGRLVRWGLPGGQMLAAELPARGASLRELAERVLRICEREGIIPALLTALAKERPRRRDEIARVLAEWEASR